MNFTDFDRDIAKEFGLTKKESRKILAFVQRKMREKILFGMNINIFKVGTLKIRVRRPRRFLHLKTNKIERTEACLFLDIKVSRRLEQQLKQKPVYYAEED